jgi:hypothetical protein
MSGGWKARFTGIAVGCLGLLFLVAEEIDAKEHVNE